MRNVGKVLLIVSLLFVAQAAVAQETYKLGAVLDVSGPVSFLGQVERNGIELAIDQINSAGGINGRKLEFVMYNDEGDVTKTVTAVKRLIEQDNVLAILGPSGSGNTLAAAPLVERAGVVLISYALSVKIVDPIKKYVFQFLPNDIHNVERSIQDMKAHGWNKVAVAYVASALGESGRDQIAAQAAPAGLQIVDSASYGEKDADLSSLATQIRRSGAQATFNWGISSSSIALLKNMQQQGVVLPTYPPAGFAHERMLGLAGEAGNMLRIAANKIVVAEQLPASDPNRAVIIEFSKAYKERFKLAPPVSAASARDSVYAIAYALKRGANDRTKLRDEIEGMKNFAAAGGTYTFSPRDHNGVGTKDLVIVTIDNGRMVLK